MSNLEQLLTRIAVALEALAQAAMPAEPNYRYQLSEYGRFAWSTIGATVLQSDRSGVTAVSWNGHVWTRRSGAGKFGKAIWFSRPSGADEEGGALYLRLVTFKDLSPAEPLPAGVGQDAGKPSKRPSAPVKPEAPAQPSGPTDWELEAMTAADPLLFDTAVLKIDPWFKDTAAVAQFRESLFGSWKDGRAAAYLVGLAEYAKQRKAGRQHKPARVEALNKYHAELETAGIVGEPMK